MSSILAQMDLESDFLLHPCCALYGIGHLYILCHLFILCFRLYIHGAQSWGTCPWFSFFVYGWSA